MSASISTGMISGATRTRGTERPARSRYAIVGAGRRSLPYLRLAYLQPETFEVVGVVTRRAEVGERVEQEFGVRTFRTVEELLAAERPEFVVTSVPWPVTPDLIRVLVATGTPVLAETPPAPDLDAMRALWADVGARELAQVAEQYPLMPLHAARIRLAGDGTIGIPGSVHVSSTHLYHVVALMRRLLGVAIGPTTVDSRTFFAPLADPITPDNWTHDLTTKRARTILSTVDFGGDRMGLYDFTDNQWWNPVRPDHLVVRGSIGEIHDETVVRMADEVTPVTSRIERSVSGIGMNYEGNELSHLSLGDRVLLRNRFEGGRLNDDEIGTAELVAATGAWARDEGPAPYPLAEGMHDHHVGIAMEESATRGTPVETGVEPWHPEAAR